MKGWRSLRESLNIDPLSGNRPKVGDQRGLQNHSAAALGAAYTVNLNWAAGGGWDGEGRADTARLHL